MEFIFQKFLNYYPKIFQGFQQLFFAIILFLIFLFVAQIIKLFVKQLIARLKDKGKIEAFLLLDRIFRSAIIVVGVISSLAVAGVNLSALLAGASIFGFIFGFALRDLISNFFAGLILLFQKPIEIGDFVEIEGKYGKVISIDIRHTILLNEEDGRQIILPNSDLLMKIVVRGKKLDKMNKS